MNRQGLVGQPGSQDTLFPRSHTGHRSFVCVYTMAGHVYPTRTKPSGKNRSRVPPTVVMVNDTLCGKPVDVKHVEKEKLKLNVPRS